MAKQQLPEVRNQTNTPANVNVPSFQNLTSSIALQPSMLGEIATNLAMRASTALAEKQGYEMGLKPQGDLGMPLTHADVAFQNAYYNQAQATLGLQAGEMMQKAQLELASADKLTPELLQSYHQNMSEGLNQILESAPSKIKPALQNNFNATLLQSMGSLSTKLIGQQKRDMRDQTNLYNQTETKGLFESGVAGNFDSGKEALKNFNERVDDNVKNGVVSRLEGEGAKDGAKLSFYSGIMANQAITAKNKNKLEPFLNDMATDKNKPKELTSLEWQKVQRNTLAYVQNLDNLQSKENNLLISQMSRQLVQTGTVEPGLLAQAEQQLPEAAFNNFVVSMMKTRRADSKRQEAQYDLSENWTNPAVHARYTDDVRNKTYESLVAKAHQENPDKNIWEIETETALSSAAPVPEYTREMTNKLNSFNPADIEQGIRAYDVMMRNNPRAIAALGSDTLAMRSAYLGRLAQGKEPTIAAEEAHQVVYGKNQEQHDENQSAWTSEVRQKKLNMPGNRLAFASNLAPMSYFSKVANPTGFSDTVIGNYETNFKLLNGDASAAKQMTKEALSMNFGDTYVNGQREFSYLPIEKVAGLPDNAAPVIQADIAEQVTLQFNELKSRYDTDQSIAYYYELMPKKDPNSPEALKVKRMYRGGNTEEFEISVQPSDLIAQTTDAANPIVGDYDVHFKNDKRTLPMTGIGPLARNVVYRPNINALKANYQKYFHLTQEDMSKRIQSYLDKEIERKKGIARGEDVFNPFQLF